jgi:hypothetical protein
MTQSGHSINAEYGLEEASAVGERLSDTPPVGNCEQMLADAEGAVAH